MGCCHPGLWSQRPASYETDKTFRLVVQKHGLSYINQPGRSPQCYANSEMLGDRLYIDLLKSLAYVSHF